MLINRVKKQFWRGLFFYCTQNLHAHCVISLRLWCKWTQCMESKINVYWKIEVGSDLANITWEVTLKTMETTEVRLGRWPGDVKKSHAPPSFFNFNSAWPFWSGDKLIWSTPSSLLSFFKSSFHFFPPNIQSWSALSYGWK